MELITFELPNKTEESPVAEGGGLFASEETGGVLSQSAPYTDSATYRLNRPRDRLSNHFSRPTGFVSAMAAL